MFCCIYVPDFAAQAALRHESNKQPLALLDGPETLLKVVASNAAARAAGVRLGMTKLQAEACSVVLRKRIQEHEDSAQATLLDCAFTFSPCIEDNSSGTVALDLTGTERLLGDGQTVAKHIRSNVAACGFDSNVAVAANPDAAHCAAKGFRGITIIPPGKEEESLGRLPIKVLPLEPDVMEVLDGWGVRDFKSLAALPTIPLSERLGQYGLHLQRLARGAVTREVMLSELPTSFQECAELEESIELLEPLGFILNRLLDQVMRRLIERSLATDHIEIELSLEIHPDYDVKATSAIHSIETQHRRTIKLPVPTQDAEVLLKLAQLDLATHPPYAPVKKARIEAIPARIRLMQMGLFQPLAPEPAKLEVTLARLRAVVGEKGAEGRGRVGFPVTIDTHHPDSFQVLPSSEKRKVSAGTASIRLALRMCRPPMLAKVETSAEKAPVWISFQRRKGRVIRAVGPWRRTGEWWDATHVWSRDEWDIYIETEGETGLYRIYRDLSTKQWFVQGMYD